MGYSLTGNNCNTLFPPCGFASLLESDSFFASRSLSEGFVRITSGADADMDDFLEDCCAPKGFEFYIHRSGLHIVLLYLDFS